MADEKEEYKFPSRSKLKEDWKMDFLSEEIWAELYEEANNLKGDDWRISQEICNRYFEKYGVPEILRTTGTNYNFDEIFEKVAIETHNNKFSLDKFKASCLKRLLNLNLAMASTYRSLKK